MSIEDSKAVAGRLLDAWNAGDFARLEGLFAEDFVNHNPPPFPGAGADRAGQLRAMQMFRTGFPDARAELVHLIAEGDTVVVHDVVRGTHQDEFMGIPATGRHADVEFIHIFRIANGKIAERWGLIDAMSLMSQIGAQPAAAHA